MSDECYICGYARDDHANGKCPSSGSSACSAAMRRLIDGHADRSHYERTHWVHCMESSENVKSVIYDPNGNALTNGELCALINELQDENEELRNART